MALATYTDLQAKIVGWLKNASLAVEAPDLIALAEADFRRQLSTPDMDATTTLTGVNPYTLPVGHKGIRAVGAADQVPHSLLPISLGEYYDRRSDGAGQSAYYVIDGNSLMIWPQPPAPLSLTLAYRTKLPSLSDASPSNWLLADHPDAYLFGSLLQAEAFGWNYELLPMWQAKVQSIIDDINRDGQRKRFGGQLAMRPPVVEQVRGTRYAFKW